MQLRVLALVGVLVLGCGAFSTVHAASVQNQAAKERAKELKKFSKQRARMAKANAANRPKPRGKVKHS